MKAFNNLREASLKNPKVIFCSLKYIILICSLTGIRFTAWLYFLLNWTHSKDVGIALQLAWFVIIELIIIQITSAFSYMISHSKMKVKRFFSFMHFKYFKFNFLMSITYALAFGGCTFAVNYLRFSQNPSRKKVYAFALILLILNAFKLIFTYFRAENPNEKFKKVTKMFFEFLSHNINRIFMFIIKFIPWIIGYIFLMIVFNKTDFEMVFYVMLNSCLYGLGIFFFPCYILGVKRLVRSAEFVVTEEKNFDISAK